MIYDTCLKPGIWTIEITDEVYVLSFWPVPFSPKERFVITLPTNPTDKRLISFMIAITKIALDNTERLLKERKQKDEVDVETESAHNELKEEIKKLEFLAQKYYPNI
jgi:hypothetical protein